MRFAHKVAAVTGGGRGIGRASSVAFAAEGASVALMATGAEALEDTARAIRAAGGRAFVAVADVADEDAVRGAIAATVQELGRLDILVNNAGITGPTAPILELD